MMKEFYIDIMEKVVDAYTTEHIRKYTQSVIDKGIEEHGYPRLAANLGALIAHGRKTELTKDFLKMMNLCCKEIPTAYEKNGDRVGNDFSVKEVVLCILELEKMGTFSKSITDRWRSALAKIDPYATYTRIAQYPPKPVNNWAAFGAASEQLRKYAGIGDESFFINNQIESQMFSFDENGMYRDPHEPMVYDMVTRLQLAMALYFGFDGECAKKLEEQFEKSADLTLKMQSVTGEIPFGGRSNQFLHNETFYAALCEFYAVFFKKRGDMKKAGMFKRAARIAAESIIPWLRETPVPHIKNYYPTDSMYGCECYAYYDKYMVTAASWAYLAYVMADDSIEEASCPSENENYICKTSEHFHKVFLKFGEYFVESDINADERYDGSGIGRIHKKGAPSAICLSIPFPPKDSSYSVDIENPSPFALCGAIKTEKGSVQGYNSSVKYTLMDEEVTESFVRATFRCEENQVEFTQTCTVSSDGVEVSVEGEGDARIYFPVFDNDGRNITEKSVGKKSVTVNYKGFACKYTSDGVITDENKIYANRNGHYMAFSARNNGKVTLKIEIC